MTGKVPQSDYFDVAKHGHVLKAAPGIAAAAREGVRIGVRMTEDDVRRIVREELKASDRSLRDALARLLVAAKAKLSGNS